ncbi:hypothetical protein ACRTDM_05265 [Shewanella algae]|uniref:hypothetical protein n=1 Tax=Shewanella algae TaxID=38313 RepID=UPI003D7D73E6
MGLRDEITADIADAFDGDLADAVKSFTGKRTVITGYDPITEQPVKQEITYTGRGTFGSYAVNIIDGVNVLATDTKLTCLQAEAVDSSGSKFTPEIDDVINGMKVIKVGKDPADVIWNIQLREA